MMSVLQVSVVPCHHRLSALRFSVEKTFGKTHGKGLRILFR